jgi:hypothetical protein
MKELDVEIEEESRGYASKSHIGHQLGEMNW